jgi:hypothetical protein
MKIELQKIDNGYILHTDPGYWVKWDNNRTQYFKTKKEAHQEIQIFLHKVINKSL